jgi:hypothetical protein
MLSFNILFNLFFVSYEKILRKYIVCKNTTTFDDDIYIDGGSQSEQRISCLNNIGECMQSLSKSWHHPKPSCHPKNKRNVYGG